MVETDHFEGELSNRSKEDSNSFLAALFHPKDATLPPSWRWIEDKEDDSGLLSSYSPIYCVKMVDDRDQLITIKSVRIDGNSIQFYVRGKLVRDKSLSQTFSSLHDLEELLDKF